MTETKPMGDPLARLAGEICDAAYESQATGLALLAAELNALAQIIPVTAGSVASGPSRTEAEIESDFDNMPV